ncbi:MAG: hypothetical protein ABIL40_06135 [candidate division WOR-3 bacterium]
MKQCGIVNIVDVIILTILLIGLSSYILIEFIISHSGFTLAPIETGYMLFVLVGVIGFLPGWCIDKLIEKIRILAGVDNKVRENMAIKFLSRIIDKYL